jgi:lipid-A-disaccharide synthase
LERVIELKKVMIIAGEASGDLHGARLVEAMRQKAPDLFLFGIGGKALKEAGVRVLIDAATLSVVGITEVISKLPSLFRGMRCAKQALKNLKPDLLILIDFPDFNLYVAAAAKKAHIPVLYYISPQIWAWRTGRVKKIGARVDHVAVILPFEEKFYKKHHVPVTFVGHPLLDAPLLPLNRAASSDKGRGFKIGLLPGSRDREVASLLPVMLEAAAMLVTRGRRVRFVISHAETVAQSFFRDILDRHRVKTGLEVHAGTVDHIFRECDLIVAASGTVTLEAAIAGVPMIIVYKVSPLSYRLGRILIQVEHIGLVNLINDEPIVTELVQDDASARNIADAVDDLISDPVKLERLRERLFGIREKLGGPGASGRVADIALDLIKRGSEVSGSRFYS